MLRGVMKSPLQLHLGSAAYCAVLATLNWTWSASYSRKSGITAESVSPAALAFLLSVAVVVYYSVKCVRAARRRLELGQKVPAGRWIRSWGVACYALPLTFYNISTSTYMEGDHSLATITSGYGHPGSGATFWSAIIGMLLFQIFDRLKFAPNESAAAGSFTTRGAA